MVHHLKKKVCFSFISILHLFIIIYMLDLESLCLPRSAHVELLFQLGVLQTKRDNVIFQGNIFFLLKNDDFLLCLCYYTLIVGYGHGTLKPINRLDSTLCSECYATLQAHLLLYVLGNFYRTPKKCFYL